MLTLLIAATAAAAAPTPARAGEVAAEMARLTSGPCYDVARSAEVPPPPSDLAGRDALVAAFGLEPGLSAKLFDRLGPGGSALVSRAIMGSKFIGDDALVLAFGGDLPGCSVGFISSSGESL